jgi:hypothetical protein
MAFAIIERSFDLPSCSKYQTCPDGGFIVFINRPALPTDVLNVLSKNKDITGQTNDVTQQVANHVCSDRWPLLPTELLVVIVRKLLPNLSVHVIK